MTELEYFNGDELAASTWFNKYAIEGEITPDDMHRRMAKEFAKIEIEYAKKYAGDFDELSEYGQEISDMIEHSDDTEIVEYIYNLFKDFKYVIPGGSVMATLGSDKLSSLSNCFVIDSPKDSISGIMNQLNNQSQLMKYRGGVGFDISTLRPMGSIVSNAAKTSTGAASFMDLFSHVTNTIAQNGRRGALMLSMNINHPDIEEFITKKQDLSKVTGANVSVQITDDFMEAVEKDKDYYLRYPCNFSIPKNMNLDVDYNVLVDLGESSYDITYDSDGAKNILQKRYIKKIKAKELWNTLIHCAHNTAEPGIMFIDRIHNYSPDGVYDDFKAVSTNPCVTGDTNILTENGYYPIQDLINQKIKVWNGKEFSEVTPKITGVDQEILIIKLSDGRELKCTPYHKWYLWEGNSRNGKSIVKEAKNLLIGDKIEKYDFPVIDKGTTVLDKIAYSQGFYSGDGNKNSNSIWLYNEKINLADKLSGNFIGTEYTTSTGAIRKMFKLNFKNNPKEFVPINEYSLQSKLSWLAGLLDSDGVLTNEKGLQIVSNDYNFLLNVQNLLSTLGCNSKIVAERKKGLRNLPDSKGGYKQYLCKETNRILVGAYQVKQLIDLGLKTYRIDLSNIDPNRDASRFVTITSIEKQENLEELVYCFEEPKNHKGVFNGILTGQCGEIPMGSYDSCRLMHLNLTSFVENPYTPDVKLKDEELYNIAYMTMRLSDDLIDLEIEAINKIVRKIKKSGDTNELTLWKNIRKTTINGRRTGMGFTGLADVIAMFNYKYGDNDSLLLTDQIANIIMTAQLDCTIDLALLRSTFPKYDDKLEFHRTNDFYEFVKINYPRQFKRMYTNYIGRRNISWSTVAPTGTVSLLTQTSSGVEPVFLPYYQRRRKCSSPNDRVDYIDNVGEKYTEFLVLHPEFKKWINLQIDTKGKIYNILDKESLEQAYKDSPWYNSTASEINWKDRIQIQSIIQKYTTHAISSTLNLNSTITENEVSDIYMDAWHKGLKGVTIYRDGSRSGILNSIKEEDTESGRQAKKRPKVLVADYYQVKSKGKQYIVLVGLLNNKPYEVFTFQPTFNVDIKPHKGTITKLKKGQYAYDSDYIQIDNLELSTDNIEEKACSLYTSMLLRHNADIKFIVKTAKKVNENITSFSSAMCRILSKYISNGEIKGEKCPQCGGKIIREAGCKHCESCDYSACQ